MQAGITVLSSGALLQLAAAAGKAIERDFDSGL